MEEHVENFMSENVALRSKLQAKTEALKILAKELDKCRTERDQFKLMAEQLQERYCTLKKKVNTPNLYTDPVNCSTNTVAQLLDDTREHNKSLKLQLETTKQCLAEARGDIQVLRQQLCTNQHKSSSLHTEELFPSHQREELVAQLEKFNEKTHQMRSDIQCLLDEKEELIKERDAFKHKAHRVSHELSVALHLAGNENIDGTMTKGNSGILIDADALVSENRYLHDRLQQADMETQLATQALAKYKNILETKRRKGIVKLGTSNTDMIMSHKQVKQLLEKGTLAELPITSATIADLKALCLGLLETLGDKTLALSHQRKANKILASRVSELETKLECLAGNKTSIFPSQVLLENYCSADADRQDITEELLLEYETTKEQQSNDIKDIHVQRPSNSSSDDGLRLPPKLQIMVDKALEELQSEASQN